MKRLILFIAFTFYFIPGAFAVDPHLPPEFSITKVSGIVPKFKIKSAEGEHGSYYSQVGGVKYHDEKGNFLGISKMKWSGSGGTVLDSDGDLVGKFSRPFFGKNKPIEIFDKNGVKIAIRKKQTPDNWIITTVDGKEIVTLKKEARTIHIKVEPSSTVPLLEVIFSPLLLFPWG